MGTKVCCESFGGEDAVVPGVMLGATEDWTEDWFVLRLSLLLP